MSLKKLNNKEFLLTAGICTIVMLFAGFTSAYLVKKNQLNWLEFPFPSIYYLSSFVVLASSLTCQLSIKQKKNSTVLLYMLLTFLLGVFFIILQIQGFLTIEKIGVTLLGENSNAAASFLLVIIGVHLLHIVGGLIAVLFQFFYSFKFQEINKTNLKLVSIYWHFLSIMWIYLFIFFKWLA